MARTIAEIKKELKELEKREKELRIEKRRLQFKALPEKEQRILKALGFEPTGGEHIETAIRKDIKI